jgi:hypothetical protein
VDRLVQQVVTAFLRFVLPFRRSSTGDQERGVDAPNFRRSSAMAAMPDCPFGRQQSEMMSWGRSRPRLRPMRCQGRGRKKHILRNTGKGWVPAT